jgi:poly-gamma-glutamate capsule biosynthesis protein CapA/YwtB (metallophosphatase superfamily)/outer membrane protein assembly factor BamB
MQTGGEPLFLASTLGRTVYALDDRGRLRWQAKTAGPAYALLPVAEGRVAVADDAGWVALLDARGSELWRHELGSRVTALQPGPQGGVLAAGWDERLTNLDANGRVQWQVPLEGPAVGVATLQSPELEQIIAVAAGQQVEAFAPDGTGLWRFDAGVQLAGVDTIHVDGTGLLLVSAQDGRLLALDQDGTMRWQWTLGIGAPVWHAADLEAAEGPQIIAGSGGDEPTLTRLSADGELRWRVSVPAPVTSILILDLDGDSAVEVLVGLSSGLVQAYDAAGRLRGAVHAGLSVWGLHATGGRAAVARADVVAWQILAGTGPTGGAWLPPPAMVTAPSYGLASGTDGVENGAVLAFLGDVALGRSMEAQLARYGPDYPWQGLAPLLGDAEQTESGSPPVIAVANLEGVLTTRGKPLNKPYLIRAHPTWVQALSQAGLDLVTLGNNHALDYGPEGLDDTLAALAAADIATVGTGPDQRPAIFTVNGVRVAFLGYAAARWNGSADVPATERLAWADPETVQADVRSARQEADIVVVLLHAGTEYASKPSPDQVAVARAAIDAGSVLVVGHHPHVTQTVEKYGDGLIVYSLGDALFDIPRPAAMRGELLRVHVTAAGLARAELWPFWIEDAIRPRLLDDGGGEPKFRIIYP